MITMNQLVYGRYAAFTALLGLAELLVAIPAVAVSGPMYLKNMIAISGRPQASPTHATLLGNSYPYEIAGRNPQNGTGSRIFRWQVEYKLSGGFIRFRTIAGVADMLGTQAAADFTVFGDGKELFTTASPQRSGDAPLNLDLDVTGIQVLSLTVTSDGSDPFPITVVWGDPALYPLGADVPAPPQWPVVQTNQSWDSSDGDGPQDESAPSPVNSSQHLPAHQLPGGSNDEPTVSTPRLDDATVLVVPFQGSFFGFPHIGESLANKIDDELGYSDSVRVVPFREYEDRLGDSSGFLSPNEIRRAGRLTGAHYLIMGEMDTCGIGHQRLDLLVTSGTKSQAVVRFEGEVADTKTGKIIKRDTEEATAKTVHIKGFDFGADDGTLLDQALQQSAEQFADVSGCFIVSRS